MSVVAQPFTPQVHWGRFDGQIKPYSRDPEGQIVILTWAPMPGSQKGFLECSVQEVLYAGSRGPGKTDALLMSFAQHIGKWGKDWRGIIFRRTYPELEDIIGKADKWFSEIFPDATYNKGKHFWEWPTGERLYFGHIRVPSDYTKYHGHNYPFLGFEEITTWPSKDCFVTMLSTNRTTNPSVPKMVRATTNPSGCVPYGEVLTDRGWVNIEEIAVGDQVLSVDAQGQQIFKPVTDVIRKYWEGEMITRRGRGLSMVFTEDHRFPHLNTSRTEHAVKSFEDLPGEAHIRRSGLPIERLREEDRFRPDAAYNSAGQHQQVDSLTANQYATLLGWVISEGCVVPRERAFCISQTKSETVPIIAELLEDCGFKFRYDGQQFWVYEGTWMDEFAKQGKCREKYIPRRIFECGTGPLRELSNALMLGDGCGNVYYTISRQLADDVAELGVRLGYATYVSSQQKKDREGLEWSVSFSERTTTVLHTGNHLYDVSSTSDSVNCSREKFAGEVYCLTVPDTETFFLRQDGCVWLSGNSGHNWVKARYKLPVKGNSYFGELCGGDTMLDEKGKPILDNQGNEMIQPERIAIHGDINENFLLLDADPGYKATIAASASSPSQLKAWLHGSWDVVAGGMFDDLWDSTVHIVEPFKIPKSWRIDRSFDWGSSKPASVGWWAESDGSDYIDAAGFRKPSVRGDLFRIHEWYMCKKGEENKGLMLTDREIANGIKERQTQHPTLMGKTIYPGPADTSIYDTTNGQSIAKAMADMGVRWTRADKSAGSRILGWQRIRNRLQASFKKAGLPRENPGLYVFDTCDAFIRTVPVAPRDDRNTEDLDSESEDHICTVGSTIVYTLEGPRTIESLVGTEGLIWTPCGWQWYEDCRLTKKDTPVITVEYPGLESMTLTPDHRIAGSEGWDFSEVIRRPVLCQTPRYSLLQCRSSKANVTTCAESIFRTKESGCIAWSGNQRTEKSQKDFTSITSIMIAQTIDSAILNCSLPANISPITCRPRKQKRDRRNPLDLPETLLLNGMDQQKARSGTSSSTKRTAKTRSTKSLRRPASDAARNIKEPGLPGSAATTARQRREELLASIMLNGNVLPAELSFQSTSITKHPHVPVPVERPLEGRIASIRDAGNSAVYCLKVPVTGCFVANGGWLLSNCDELRYRIYSRTGKMINKRIRGR